MLKALEHILRNNNFKFDEKFNQIERTVTETKYSPPIHLLCSSIYKRKYIISNRITKVFPNRRTELKIINDVF